MSFIGDLLGGDSPHVEQGPPLSSTLSPNQQYVSDLLKNFIMNRGMVPTQYNMNLTAPLSGLQNQSLTALEQSALPAASGTVQGAGATGTAANTALQSILAQGPQFSADLFSKAIAAPMMKNFNEQVVPSLQSAFGSNAGGVHSSDYIKGVTKATDDLNKSLESGAASFALQNEGNVLSAAGQVPGLLTSGTGALMSALAAGGVPQQQEQNVLSNNYAEFQRQVGQQNQFVNQLLGFMGIPTMNTNAVVNPGQQGLISGMAPGIGTGLGLGLASLFL